MWSQTLSKSPYYSSDAIHQSMVLLFSTKCKQKQLRVRKLMQGTYFPQRQFTNIWFSYLSQDVNKSRVRVRNLMQGTINPQIQFTNLWCSYIPQDVTKSRMRLRNLMQCTIPSSNAIHQLWCSYFSQDVNKSSVVSNLKQVTILFLRCNSPIHGAPIFHKM